MYDDTTLSELLIACIATALQPADQPKAPAPLTRAGGVEKLHGRNEGVNAFGRRFPFVKHVEFVLPDRLKVWLFGPRVVEVRLFGDVMEVTS